MTAKYFARIDVGSELEDRIHELLEVQTDGAQEDYATIRTGMFHLIIHYLDLYMVKEPRSHPVNRNIYEGDIPKLDQSVVSDKRIKVRYVCNSGGMSSGDSMDLKVVLSSNRTPVEELKGELLELMKQACDDYELGIRYQMVLFTIHADS